ncbi:MULTISPECIES: hypothetical protein [Bradyrhizobium]|uniref:hypothetical protein n=1 Tax=Bradyrhizobium TaxID=374 RepID=UPI0008ED7D19|nr:MULTISPECIES: hypothetical protein [Bradyrhizobium]SFV19102.1 hypothetical protein SAMN05192541_14536 [Bradyrhizobium arachidis]
MTRVGDPVTNHGNDETIVMVSKVYDKDGEHGEAEMAVKYQTRWIGGGMSACDDSFDPRRARPREFPN